MESSSLLQSTAPRPLDIAPLAAPPVRVSDVSNHTTPGYLSAAPVRIVHTTPATGARMAGALAAPAHRRPTAMGAPLNVRGQSMPRVTFSDLRPGDLAFQYQPKNRVVKQRIISLGERVGNLVHRHRGSPYIVHAFLVVDPRPARREIIAADAAAGDLQDTISLLSMNFNNGDNLNPNATYLFYRVRDRDLQKRIARTAANWCTPGGTNFSTSRAVNAIFHSSRPGRRTQRAAAWMASQVDKPAALRLQGSNQLYRMMCSEFVANVCQAAAVRQWQDGHRRPGDVRGLTHGSVGDTFAVDARAMTPAALHARVAASPYVKPVGWLPAVGA
ncbi:MAG TPA: hypothetical protein VFH51_04535 [Myxococcota bacterium]|nr:hypothetical protein [Myxococcota bacterium]